MSVPYVDSTIPPAVDIFVGPQFRYRTRLTDNDEAYCLADVEIPSGAIVPIHSHDDRETFYILSGALEAFLDDAWQTYTAGSVFDVVDGAPHALRNLSGQPVTLLLVTTMRLGRFFLEVGRPASQDLPPPAPADMQHFIETSHRYGYWMGDDADNAAIGLQSAAA